MVAQQAHGGAHISRESALWICCGQRVDIQGVRPEQANQRKTPPDERPSDGVSLEELCRVETGQHPLITPAIFDRNMAGWERLSAWRIIKPCRLPRVAQPQTASARPLALGPYWFGPDVAAQTANSPAGFLSRGEAIGVWAVPLYATCLIYCWGPREHHRRVRKPARSALRSASGRTGHKEKAGRRLLRSAATMNMTAKRKR